MFGFSFIVEIAISIQIPHQNIHGNFGFFPVEDGLPFRCRDRLELTLVFEARDLNLVIEKMVRSGI